MAKYFWISSTNNAVWRIKQVIFHCKKVCKQNLMLICERKRGSSNRESRNTANKGLDVLFLRFLANVSSTGAMMNA